MGRKFHDNGKYTYPSTNERGYVAALANPECGVPFRRIRANEMGHPVCAVQTFPKDISGYQLLGAS